jgi:hypothetical protein
VGYKYTGKTGNEVMIEIYREKLRIKDEKE